MGGRQGRSQGRSAYASTTSFPFSPKGNGCAEVRAARATPGTAAGMNAARTPNKPSSAAVLPFLKGEQATQSGRAGRPDEAPKPSIRASVPSSVESRAFTSHSRA